MSPAFIQFSKDIKEDAEVKSLKKLKAKQHSQTVINIVSSGNIHKMHQHFAKEWVDKWNS